EPNALAGCSTGRVLPRRHGCRATPAPTPLRVSRDRRASGTACPANSAWTCSRFWDRRACFFVGKKSARLQGVGVKLPGQRGKVGVAFLVAKLVQKLDDDSPAVDRVVEIENEYFEQRSRVRLDRRPHAQARDARARRRPEAVNAHGEYARQWRLAA